MKQDKFDKGKFLDDYAILIDSFSTQTHIFAFEYLCNMMVLTFDISKFDLLEFIVWNQLISILKKLITFGLINS